MEPNEPGGGLAADGAAAPGMGGAEPTQTEPIQGEGPSEPHNDGDEAEPSDNEGEPSGRDDTGSQGESGTGVGTDEGAGNTAPESERNPEPTDTEGTGEDGRGSDEGSGRTDTEGTGQPGTHTDGVDEGADGNPDLSPGADGNDAGMASERSEREPEKIICDIRNEGNEPNNCNSNVSIERFLSFS